MHSEGGGIYEVFLLGGDSTQDGVGKKSHEVSIPHGKKGGGGGKSGGGDYAR